MNHVTCVTKESFLKFETKVFVSSLSLPYRTTFYKTDRFLGHEGVRLGESI